MTDTSDAVDAVPSIAAAADASQAVFPSYPDAQGFEAHHNGVTLMGWTFRTGSGPRARFSWVTTAGSYGKGSEPYRSEAAAMLPMAVLDDQRQAARRAEMRAHDGIQAAVEALHPNANLWRPVRYGGRKIAWTFRTDYDTTAQFGHVLNDATVGDSHHGERDAAAYAARIAYLDKVTQARTAGAISSAPDTPQERAPRAATAGHN